ncbi:uncharacterized protein FIBRA_01807 [Fibroporia radiculosa]|uniref:Uncharacterized protein n=1 Tax=Fibroporia radiculosa TaxID=599839 RepID=J4GLE9_9APHY|nr:uncharacterized protein FIBRA_01807 [Fibroporia radiculosa]CCL99785.1 predicted protein [Fibroporia radiculosa]
MDWEDVYLFPFALALTVLEYMAICFGLPSPGPQRDHFAPHPSAKFEGYYTRVQLEDGGTLALIFCWVKNAKIRENLVCVIHAPADGSKVPSFYHEIYPEQLSITAKDPTSKTPSFRINVPGLGNMTVTSSRTEYTLAIPDVRLSLTLCLTNHTSWLRTRPLSGPMGPLARLSRYLPLNWHVYSLASDADYTIVLAGRTYTGHGVAHLEKNWGRSFPSGWLWSQTFKVDNETICLAGGSALPGVQAYLVGYRSTGLCWDFRPPFTMGIGLFSPFLRVQCDSGAGVVELEARTWLRKLKVNIHAPVDSFIGLPAPLKDGHQPQFAFESFRATVITEAYIRCWPWGGWERAEEDHPKTVENEVSSASLEFGGIFSHLVNHYDNMARIRPGDSSLACSVTNPQPRSIILLDMSDGSATSVEINDALFCTHFKEVCTECSFDGREENDSFFGFDPIDREGIEAPPASVNKDGEYQCKKHGSTLLRVEEADHQGPDGRQEGGQEVVASVRLAGGSKSRTYVV